MVHYNPYIVGWCNTLYNPTKQGFFVAHMTINNQPFEDVSPMFKIMIFQPVMLRKLFSRVPTRFLLTKWQWTSTFSTSIQTYPNQVQIILPGFSNECPVKINGWKMYFLLNQLFFGGHVSFWGCRCFPLLSLFLLECVPK